MFPPPVTCSGFAQTLASSVPNKTEKTNQPETIMGAVDVLATAQPHVHVVPVDDEPLHQQRWKSDIVRVVCVQFPPRTTCKWHQHVKYGIYVCITDLQATEQPVGASPRPLTIRGGDVFCRDHTVDRLAHVITTHDLPLFIVEVELLKEKHVIKPHDQIPLHEHPAIVMLEDKLECRVYRITLSHHHGTSELSLELATDAVLVVLTECTVVIALETDVHAPPAPPLPGRVMRLRPGDDLALKAGTFAMKLVPDTATVNSARFILAEVF